MTDFVKRHARDQGGYTLIELLVASAIGLIVMSGLTSVVLSSFRAASIATSRVEASGQIRSFQLDAYTDFAGSSLPTPSGCGTETNRCTTQAISLQGLQSGNTTIPSPASYKVTYTWNSAKFMLDRKVGSMEARHAATNVTDFSWYVDGTSLHRTVVVSLTVTVPLCSVSPRPALCYSESQTLRFYPRVSP
ncbi:MAG: type II secretion system protein [Chloroflexi bacterium]|nr:MAG: type II secretion system protein [Chloroflexota bacterium]TME14722.1 MAG: type II secretion system protein [Chloroflexota bacterium]TME15152.1 MAG: type II secretion system protein [Chloroflexota bacterium]